MLLKDWVLVSQTELIIYIQTILNMAHAIFSIVFQLLLFICYVMDNNNNNNNICLKSNIQTSSVDMHPVVFLMLQL